MLGEMVLISEKTSIGGSRRWPRRNPHWENQDVCGQENEDRGGGSRGENGKTIRGFHQSFRPRGELGGKGQLVPDSRLASWTGP